MRIFGSPPDLQFEPEANQHLIVEANDRQRAVELPTTLEGNVIVSSFDYGAYSEFEAIAEFENGQVVYGVVRGSTSGEPLKLPDCKQGSLKAYDRALGLSKKGGDGSSRDQYTPSLRFPSRWKSAV